MPNYFELLQTASYGLGAVLRTRYQDSRDKPTYKTDIKTQITTLNR